MGVHTSACSLCRHFNELVHPDRKDEMVSVFLGIQPSKDGDWD